MREAGHHGQHAGARETERFELLAIELRVAEREIAARRVDAELAATEITQLHQQRMHADEILRRRDVVVDEHHALGQRVGDARGPRSDREVMDQDVVGMAGRRAARGIPGEVLEPRIGGLDEDLRLVAGFAQHALDADTSWPIASP